MQAKLQEKVEYTDLAPPSGTGSAPALRLTRLDRYLHGPTVVTSAQYHTNDDVLRASRTVVQEMLSWQPQLTQVRFGIKLVFIHGLLCLFPAERNCRSFCYEDVT